MSAGPSDTGVRRIDWPGASGRGHDDGPTGEPVGPRPPARVYPRPVARSPQTLSVDERRTVASWAAACAEQVLAIYETAVPGDTRVRAAIEQARSFAAGGLEVRDAVRRRGGDAGAAAREAPTQAAKAAAYAAEQAAAVAHMGAHSLGAAGYAVKAATLASGGPDDAVARSEVRRQVVAMTDAVARALASLPALGENDAGPLGPGRLRAGHVGEAIRSIQSQLRSRRSETASPPP